MSADSARPQTAARVLVVDDNRLIRELAREALGERVRVECVDSAEAALDALSTEPADLVISDLTMEGLSGLDLLERVRRSHPGTDFVLLTGNATVESAVRALRMGAADYLLKPIRPEQLGATVERLLAHRRVLDENQRLRSSIAAMEACRTLLQCLDAGEVYAVALDLLLHAVSRQRGFAQFRRPGVPGNDGMAFRGFSEGESLTLRRVLSDEKPLDAGTFDEQRVVPIGTFEAALRAAGLPAEPALAVPLRGQEDEEGVVWILGGGRPFAGHELEQAKRIASYANLALENAERYFRAKERAFVDDVTEVYNARYLLQATEHEIQRAERYGKPLSVLFLDLDRFKRVNDEHGHLVGSQVLRRLSEVLSECIRQVDTLARYGGDEFTILLTDTPHDVALAVAERIRRTVADTLFEGGGGAPVRLSISIGVATHPSHSADRDGLLDVADKAMYRAKSLGRNCVCSATDLDAGGEPD